MLVLDWVRFESFSVRLWLGLGKVAKSEFFSLGLTVILGSGVVIYDYLSGNKLW